MLKQLLNYLSRRRSSAYSKGQQLQAVVQGAIKGSAAYGLYIKLPNNEVGVLPRHKMPTRASFRPGQQVQVQVHAADGRGLTLSLA